MGRRDRRHGLGGRRGEPGRARTLLVLLVALVLTLAATATYRPDLVDRVLGERPVVEPAAVPPPPGLTLPPVVAPSPVAAAAEPAALDRREVRRALAPYLADDALGRHVLAAVSGLEPAATPVVSIGAGAAVPASTTKLLTALAALSVLDPQARFETRVVRDGRRVVLVGGGDPLLARAPAAPDEQEWPTRADVTTLAADTAEALLAEGVTRVRVGYDAGLFTGPAENPRWRADYVPDGIVSPTSALWVDQGRPPGDAPGRDADPSLAAAQAFVRGLQQAGVRVGGAPRAVASPADAAVVATATSATVAELVEHVLLVSDNEGSEVLLRHVGLQGAGQGSTDAGLAVVRQVLADLGVPVDGLAVHDGSGLSRQNRIAPATLLGVLRASATGSPRLRTVVAALPVAGFTGSLSGRFEEAPTAGRGRVRAKTGTLTGISSLAGVATGTDGVPMAFVLMSDRVEVEDTLDARDALDGAAAALGACRCGVGP